MTEQEAYETLLVKLQQVFGNEIHHLSDTQKDILDGLDIGQGGVTQGGLQQGESGRGGGSAGDAVQGIQLGRGTINAIQELFGMNVLRLKHQL